MCFQSQKGTLWVLYLAETNFLQKTFELEEKWKWRFKGEFEASGTFSLKFHMKSSMKKSVFSTTKEDTSILFTPCERQEESGNNHYL